MPCYSSYCNMRSCGADLLSSDLLRLPTRRQQGRLPSGCACCTRRSVHVSGDGCSCSCNPTSICAPDSVQCVSADDRSLQAQSREAKMSMPRLSPTHHHAAGPASKALSWLQAQSKAAGAPVMNPTHYAWPTNMLLAQAQPGTRNLPSVFLVQAETFLNQWVCQGRVSPPRRRPPPPPPPGGLSSCTILQPHGPLDLHLTSWMWQWGALCELHRTAPCKAAAGPISRKRLCPALIHKTCSACAQVEGALSLARLLLRGLQERLPCQGQG